MHSLGDTICRITAVIVQMKQYGLHTAVCAAAYRNLIVATGEVWHVFKLSCHEQCSRLLPVITLFLIDVGVWPSRIVQQQLRPGERLQSPARGSHLTC